MYYDFEHQVLIGTILGGSSLVLPQAGKNCYLAMRDKNELWLKYKMAEMPTYFSGIFVKKYGGTYRCTSRCSERLFALRTYMYEENRRNITMPILDTLQDTALAVWFLDSGSKMGRNRKNAYLNMANFPDASLIEQYFNELGMMCRRQKGRLVFTVPGTRNFLRTIAHRFPSFMYHRI